MPIVSATRLRVRSWRHIPAVVQATLRSALQAKAADGNLAVSILAEAHMTFWTRTAWTDGRSMNAFVMAGVHRRIMGSLLVWCCEASVLHWAQDTAELPSWEETHRRLKKDGRHTTSDPSGSFPVPMPRAHRWAELRWRNDARDVPISHSRQAG